MSRRGQSRARVGELTSAERAHIRAAVAALPPMSEDQIAGVCEVITVARERWRRQQARTGLD